MMTSSHHDIDDVYIKSSSDGIYNTYSTHTWLHTDS